jgi:hypothetical protein
MSERYHSKLVKLLTAGAILSRVRKSYEDMTVALTQAPGNDTIRFLHAGTAIEIADRFPEFLPDAGDDIKWIESNIAPEDSIRLFFLNLLEAKFYYKRGLLTEERLHFQTAWLFIKKASTLACNKHHLNEVMVWEERILKQLQKK